MAESLSVYQFTQEGFYSSESETLEKYKKQGFTQPFHPLLTCFYELLNVVMTIKP